MAKSDMKAEYEAGVSIDELASKYEMTTQEVTDAVVMPVKDTATQG